MTDQRDQPSIKEPEVKEPKPTASGSVEEARTTGFEETCLALLQETATRQTALCQDMGNVSGQGAFLRQQVSQLYEAVRQLYDAVGTQCRQLLESDGALQQELQRFQTGGPQRAMAGVFHKLFRDLVRHVAELDELLALA